ncbi:hypothetical protein BCR44DRAFT_239965 [Catenaria anguillulae PL171]|uniref:Uncharacterized protein n=1 Tax=Catenaria anguillulae PL171 TaxID=765915 RepID=A0A1Y2H453_9FUNG|nr:hypothetical protein BCR44DRAFT_239965 [Catenaria anguillulae PL171]
MLNIILTHVIMFRLYKIDQHGDQRDAFDHDAQHSPAGGTWGAGQMMKHWSFWKERGARTIPPPQEQSVRQWTRNPQHVELGEACSRVHDTNCMPRKTKKSKGERENKQKKYEQTQGT